MNKFVKALREEFGDIIVFTVTEYENGEKATIETNILAASIHSLNVFGESLGGVATKAHGMIFMFNGYGPKEIK